MTQNVKSEQNNSILKQFSDYRKQISFPGYLFITDSDCASLLMIMFSERICK